MIYRTFLLCLCLLMPLSAQADTYGTPITTDGNGNNLWSGIYPDTGWLKRPYKIGFTSNIDGASDWFTISFPDDFDPDQSYPVWLKFKPFFGSGSHVTGPSHAWNYCDANDVIMIGCNERTTGDSWFGDTEYLDADLRANIPADVIEILNQLFELFNITYVAASGPSMGGYASLRLMTYLPSNYVGAVVSSAPALWTHWYTQTGSDAIGAAVSNGHFNNSFVKILHGTDDATVPVSVARQLTALSPSTNWWELVEVPGAGHAEFFMVYNSGQAFPYTEEYGQSSVVPDMWTQIANWETAHPEIATTVLTPLPGWTAPTNWYFNQTIVADRANKGPTPNVPPFPNAGPDQFVTDWDTNGSEQVTLDGTASTDSDGSIIYFAWVHDSSTIASGPNPTTSLNLGTNLVSLIVTDDDGDSATSTVTIVVGAPDFTAPAPVTGLAGTPGNGFADLTWTASVSSDVIAHHIYIDGLLHNTIGDVTAYTVPSLDNGTLYTLGVTALDPSTNESTLATVDVTPVGPAPGSIVTSLFQKGVSPDAGFTGTLDSTIRSLTGHTHGLQSLGKDTAMDMRYADIEGSACLWFDVSSIPTNATVHSASLKIWHDANEFDGSGNVLVYRLDDPSGTGMWVENDDASSYTETEKGCSRYKRPSIAWSGSGGRITDVINESNKATVAHTALTDEWLTADVSADIGLFVAAPADNVGWMIRAQADNTLRGNTYMSDHSDAAKRPILEVVYSLGSGGSPSNVAPTAVASATPLTGQAPLLVNFDASSSSDSDGMIVSYNWNFGDGGSSTQQSPSHSYTLPGTHTATVTVTDNDGAIDADSVFVYVTNSPVNLPPVLDPIGNKVVDAGSLISFTVTATDPNLDPMTFQAQNLPAGASFTTQTFSWTPLASQTGSYGVTFIVQDSELATDDETIQITVQPAAPVGSTSTSLFQKGVSPDASFAGNLDSTIRSLTGHTFGQQALGKDQAMDLRYADSEGSAMLWFDVSSIPSYATVQSATLKIWHDANEFDGSGNLLVYRIHDPSETGMWVENDDATTYTESDKGCSRYKRPGVAWNGSGGRITDVINESNKVTVPHTALADEWLSADVTADITLFVANSTNNLGWMIRTQSDNTLRGSTYMSDHTDSAKRPVLEVTYTAGPPPNQAPTAVAAATPTSGLDPLTVNFDATGSTDSDGAIVSYAWDFGDGTSSTQASPSHIYSIVGYYTSTVTVTDDDGAMDSDSLQITVNSTNGPPNQSPVLNPIGDKNVNAGSLLSFSISATDPDLDPMTYSAQNLPAGASFAGQTFSWTPGVSITGAYSVTFLVHDDELANDSETIDITVLPWQPPATNVSGQIVPPLTEILAASAFLSPGDIPEDNFEPPTNYIYVATNGSDSNTGLSIDQPFLRLGKAISYAQSHGSTPFTIYLRGGTHYYKSYDIYQTIGRGNLYITAYHDEDVVIRPWFWPNAPTAGWEDVCFGINGSFDNLTFDNLSFEGWNLIFTASSSLSSDPIRHLTMKNIHAYGFRHRWDASAFIRVFFQTGYLQNDVYGAGKEIFDDPTVAHYQLEDVIIQNCTVDEADISINVGDENDANIKGLRISNYTLINPEGGSGDSANDGIAIVNSYKILIDSTTIKNSRDDGIDCKSYDVSVVNTLVEGTGRNAVKFWRNGELINSIIYDCTIINDAALTCADGPLRIVNSALIKKNVGYSGTLYYDGSTMVNPRYEIVNSIFLDLAHSIYVGDHAFTGGLDDMTSLNSLYRNMPDRLFSGAPGNINNVTELNSRSGSSGNVDADPLLTDMPGGDFSPTTNSACIDAGTTNGVLLPTFDFMGRTRIAGAAPDIGPIEYNVGMIDSDLDGLSDHEEDIAGTNPNNPNDYFHAMASMNSSSNATIQWQGVLGRRYQLLTCTNLFSSWIPVVGYTDMPGTGGMLSISNIPFDDAVYYRLKVWKE